MNTSHKDIATKFNIEQRTIISLIEKYKTQLEQLGEISTNTEGYLLNAEQEMFLVLNMKNTSSVLELKLNMVKRLNKNKQQTTTETKKPLTQEEITKEKTLKKQEYNRLQKEIKEYQDNMSSHYSNTHTYTAAGQNNPSSTNVRERAPF